MSGSGLPLGVFGEYDALGNAPTLGFNIRPLIPQWAKNLRLPQFGFAPPAAAAPNNTGAAPMTLFGGGASTSGGFDWGGLIGSIGSSAIQIMNAKQQNKMLKRLTRLQAGGGLGALSSGFVAPSAVPAVTGGSQLGSVLQTLGLGGLAGGAASLLPELGDMLPGGLEESGTGLFGPDLFRVGAQSRSQRMIDAVHPTSGERVYWRPVGRPIMFTGDAALLKRTRKMVRKMSSQAGCGLGGRTFRRRRR